MFDSDDIDFINRAFLKLTDVNAFLQGYGCNRVVFPSKFTETLAQVIYENVTGHNILRKESGWKGDLFDATTGEDIEVKSTTLINQNDLTSFGAKEEFDKILFLEIDEKNNVVYLYDIPISHNIIMDVVVSKDGETYRNKCGQGKKTRRPHFSIKKWLIGKMNVVPLCTVYFKEGAWQI